MSFIYSVISFVIIDLYLQYMKVNYNEVYKTKKQFTWQVHNMQFNWCPLCLFYPTRPQQKLYFIKVSCTEITFS